MSMQVMGTHTGLLYYNNKEWRINSFDFMFLNWLQTFEGFRFVQRDHSHRVWSIIVT